MEFTRVGKTCSFCGVVWTGDNPFAGGYGAQICRECALRAVHMLTDTGEFHRSHKAPWEDVSTEQMLDTLPDIVATADQVDDFLHGWVGLLRERGVSWAQVGTALGVTRQAAWQRFTRAKRYLSPDA